VNAVVVDASVAVKWVVPEKYSEAAERLLVNGTQLYAPGHWLAEVATTLWAKCAIRQALTQSQARATLQLISDLAVEETPIRYLIEPASQAALQLHLTVYDTLYLALASRHAVPVVTADHKLFEIAKGDPHFQDLVVWVADL
jgi:predicted nucleic acid-binding protein